MPTRLPLRTIWSVRTPSARSARIAASPMGFFGSAVM
jgi:hypothetical protein